ncbi:endoglucanase 1 [Gymnopilus junonius]|uniref:cellulase n=1 Tax=Gymnopilus junonius TaxID=109634 RepID=A0A9P5NVS5_GYMJU|nr:endoglucanase 1 [Gymnopilus junonius]
MFLAPLLTLLTSSTVALAKILYAGVNESGGEFGVFGVKGQGLPGRFGVDYAFINKSTIDIFVDQEKINFFRVTFLMERMAPLEFGLGARFNETYFSEYADAVNYITLTKGAYALIDPHNYMRYNDPSSQPFSGSVIGNTTDPTAATTLQFGQFWGELARRFISNPKVVFGINNEPHDMPTQLILLNNQVAIDHIRAAGAPQLILAPGNGFTGGHSWTQTTGANDAPSSQFLNKLVDPLRNTAIDIHEYLDIDFSGSHDECMQPAPSNLANLTIWLQENHLKQVSFPASKFLLNPTNNIHIPNRAVISEFGGGNNENCFQFIDTMLDYLATNDVYIGWSIWAAGPIWGTSAPCCGADTGSLEPGQLNDLGQPDAFTTVWANAVRPNIPKNLKRSGVSSLS